FKTVIWKKKIKNMFMEHSFIVYRLSDLHSGHGEPVPISGIIGHQGRIHPEQSANPSQGTHTHSQFRYASNLQCMSLNRGRKPEYPEETPKARGEHANSTHRAEAGIKPLTLEVWGKRANHQATQHLTDELSFFKC
ncbi:hypothetical protein QTP70_023222, partial [Hemibagrus guttatus]